MEHEEVPDRVDALDGVFVVVIGAEEPWVLGFDEVPGRLGTPELHDKKDGLATHVANANGAEVGSYFELKVRV